MTDTAAEEAKELSSETNIKRSKFLTFFLGEEEYAIDVLKVQEIIGLQPITPIPRGPSYIRGVLNLRGKIVPIMNLRTRFDLQEVEDTEETCIVVVQDEEYVMGVLVDRVSEVVGIEQTNIEDVPSVKPGKQNEYLDGLGKVDDSVKMIIEVHKVLFDVPEELLNVSEEEQSTPN